jgi:hypothetical protein
MKLLKNYQVNRLVLLFLFLSTAGFSQNYLSKQITTNQGLPDNDVCSILKDKENRLWIGTSNGLALLTGKTTKIFKKKDGLAHNFCWAIVQDKLGQIWIGTFGGGLSLYKNGKFINFTTENGLPSNKIRRLFVKGEELYIGTANGFSKINIKNHQIKNYQINDKRVVYGVPKDVEVLNIIEVNNNIVFNTHSHGIYTLKDETVVVLNKSLYSTFSLFKNNNKIYIGKNGQAEKGLSIISTDVASFLEGKSKFETVQCENTIFWNFIRINDDTFFGGANGVEYYTGGLYEIKKNAKNVNKIFGIQNSKIWSLFYDKTTNLLYVGTLGDGLYIVDLDKKVLKQQNASTLDFKRNEYYKNVYLHPDSITIERKNQKISLSKGVLYSIIKSKIDKMPTYLQMNCTGSIGKFDKKEFSLNSIELDNYNIFINTNYGLLKLCFDTKIISKELFLYSMETYKFDNNSLFFYYPYNSIYYVPNVKNQNNKIFFDRFVNKKYPQNIFDIIFTKNNKFFISSTEGLYKLKGNNYKEYEFPLLYKGFEFVSAHQYSNHQIVLGTLEGNVYFLDDKKDIQLTKLFDKDELIGNTIQKIASYKKHLLIFTEKGINILDISSRKVYFIDAEMGVNYKNVNSSSIFGDKLLMATDEGSYEIDLKKFLSNKGSATFPYYIENFMTNDISSLNNEIFDHDENRIQIQLGNSFRLYPNKLLFQFKINGLKNTNWSQWTDNSKIDLPYVPPGKYEILLRYKDLATGETGIKALKKFKINFPLWQNLYFIICFFMFSGALIIIYFRRKISNIKNRANEKLNFERRIVETKMEALQSQMNPHFIFNSLNVIQYFVLKNDTENSINYINSFSKLMRTTLENSSEFKISILEEVKFLKLYVEVQNIRFNNQVKFKITISPDLDKYQKIIPPMLIQPLIENCFEHAFNETVANPEIVLEIKNEANEIIVSVTDNGLGFQEKSHIKSQSKALKLVEERIKLLGKDNKLVKERLSNGTCISFSI